MKRTMGLILIAIGAAMIIAGIFIVSSSHNKSTASADIEKTGVRADSYSDTGLDGETSTNSLTGSASANGISGQTPTSSEASVSTDQNTLSSKEKGDLFEDFTVNLLADWRLKLLDRTQDKVSSAGVVAESCRQPDLHVQQKRGKSQIDYFLECKYRSDWHDDAVTFEDWQIKRYKDFQRSSHRKVIIALGIGGSPSTPKTFMLVPIDSLKDNSIKKVWVSRYAVQPNSENLVNYIDSYFDEVFATARKKKKE